MTTTPEHVPMPEGAVQAPSGTRVMGVLRWMLVAAMAVAATISVVSYLRTSSSGQLHASATLYHCPLHPAVLQDHPGDCPICGMSLVLVEGGGASAKPTQPQPEPGHEGHRHEPSDPFACPMHP
ncbi:MAG: hypothetical protein HY901_04060, partial [Deltaproteobacteria bacterium]|nr:hypothetical protein [Deltaproteobacteria bacterium]